MKKQLLWLYITVFINILGFGMVLPLLPLFAETFQATDLQIGLLAASFSIAQFFAAPFFGRLSDRYGRKPILVASIIGSIFSFLLIATANSLWVLFVARAINGLSSAGNFPIAAAYTADITSKEERAEYMSKIAAIFALGFVFGPLFSGLLGVYGFPVVFAVAAMINLVNLIQVVFFLPESIKNKSEELLLREGLLNFKAIYKGLRGDFGVLFFLLFAWAFYVSNFQVAIPLFTQEKFSFGAFEIGMFFALTGFVSSVGQWFILPRVVKRFGEIKTIITGIVLMILGQVFAPLSATANLFYLCFVVSVTGSSFHRPTINALISEKTKEGQGTTMGLAFSFESLGRVFGPLLAGVMIGTFGPAIPFWSTAVILLFGLYLFWLAEVRSS